MTATNFFQSFKCEWGRHANQENGCQNNGDICECECHNHPDSDDYQDYLNNAPTWERVAEQLLTGQTP